jgi:hypothetical protein
LIYILLKIVVCLLAIYGLFILGRTAAVHIPGRSPKKHPRLVVDRAICPPMYPDVRMVLLVRDVEEQIEYIVRTAVKNDFASRAMSDNSLVIIDMDSSDNTFLLLEKLQKDFSNVEALKFEDREHILEDFNIFSHSPK